MKTAISELREIVAQYRPRLEQLDENNLTAKPQPGKWSKKEIIGHLVDSAQTNIRRFVMGQYEERPHLVYDQDQWVRIGNYQNYPTAALVALWALLNQHICHILENTNSIAAAREVRTQAVHSIEWLANDYNKHLLHHLHQVLDMEPVAYP